MLGDREMGMGVATWRLKKYIYNQFLNNFFLKLNDFS